MQSNTNPTTIIERITGSADKKRTKQILIILILVEPPAGPVKLYELSANHWKPLPRDTLPRKIDTQRLTELLYLEDYIESIHYYMIVLSVVVFNSYTAVYSRSLPFGITTSITCKTLLDDARTSGTPKQEYWCFFHPSFVLTTSVEEKPHYHFVKN